MRSLSSLGRDRRWVYRKVADHGLPAIKLGRELCFQLEAVQTWLIQHRVGEWPAEGVDA